MTVDEQITKTRCLLDFAQKFRRGVADLTHGEAKAAVLARADATIAKIEAALRDLQALASLSTETLQ
jgi:hypothetical protein